jgi:hypothetical protein
MNNFIRWFLLSKPSETLSTGTEKSIGEISLFSRKKPSPTAITLKRRNELSHAVIIHSASNGWLGANLGLQGDTVELALEM